MKQKRIAIVLTISAIVITIIGSTFAYFTWATNASQNTAVTFTVTPTFSCSADGGGNITSQQKQLAPAACTNSTYAIQRTITTNITNSGTTPVRMNLDLKINSISSSLASSNFFRYSITSSSTNCTTGVINGGTFQGKVANDTVTLLEDATSSGTYYLWIWLDSAETNNNTQDQLFNFSLDGSCTDEPINYVYTANIYDENATGYNAVWLLQPIPNGMTTYNTPDEAMTAMEVAYSNANSGAARSFPLFLKHRIGDIVQWCAVRNIDGEDYNSCDEYNEYFFTEEQCNHAIEDYLDTDTCVSRTLTNVVTESYVGFVITPAMATANPSMTAGTYYLRGGYNSTAYNDNIATLLTSFGSTNCSDSSPHFICYVTNSNWYYADVELYGDVTFSDYGGSLCEFRSENGNSYCQVPSGGSVSPK